MDATTLSELRKPRPYPAVSVLMPVHRAFPGDRREPGALRGALAEVRRMLRDDDRVTPDVAEHTRTPRYWLLCLSERGARLWDGCGGRLTEHGRDGFPVASRPGGAAGEAGVERLREVARAAADGAERVLARDRRPLIVASGTRGQALFDEQAGPHVTVAGRVDGDFEDASPATLVVAARPALAAYEDLREVGVLSELEAARRIALVTRY